MLVSTKARKIAGAAAATMAVMAALATGCMLAGCSSQPSPSQVTSSFLEAVKTCDTEQMAASYSGEAVEASDFDSLMEAASSEDRDEAAESSEDGAKWTDEQKEVLQSLVDKARDFDYEIVGETVDGDKAAVEVKLAAYEIGDAVENAISDFMSKALMYAFSENASEEKMQNLLVKAIDSEVRNLEEKKYEKTVTFNLSKGEGGWKVDVLEGEQLDAMFGGLYGSLEDLSSL